MKALTENSLLQTVDFEAISNEAALVASLVGNGKLSLVHHCIV